MHHIIFPEKDTFITNTLGFDTLNFGLDEILKVGTQTTSTRVVYPTTIYPINGNISNLCVDGYSGSLYTASFYGGGTIIGSVISTTPVSFSIDFFKGTLTGSHLSASGISSSNFTGSFSSFTGSAYGIISGSVSGSFSGSLFEVFNGSIINFIGKLTYATASGANIKNVQRTEVISNAYANRALIQFDLTSISKSIASGDIVSPNFKLKMFVARELNLPITYSVFAFPVSESWIMENGYVSDDGSSKGASWIYRDFKNGTPWSTTGSTYVQSVSATQSFNYQVGDINMDVSQIVQRWLSGSIRNNGFVVISDDEFVPTSSGMGLYFFSKDTNTIYEPVLDVSWDDFSFITGSVSTSSVVMGTYPIGLDGKISDNSASINRSLFGAFQGTASLNLGSVDSEGNVVVLGGVINAIGVSQLIFGMPIIGGVVGNISSSVWPIIKKCGNCPTTASTGFIFPSPSQPQFGWSDALSNAVSYNWYTWGPTTTQTTTTQIVDTWNWLNWWNWNWTDKVNETCSMATMSFLRGTITTGNFSGSIITASLVDGYLIPYGYLTGSWNNSMLVGAGISASYPFGPLFPSASNVMFTGPYVIGPAFGGFSAINFGATGSGIFDGTFTGGSLAGLKIHAPFTGSFLTSSVNYTSSVSFISSSLSPLDVRKPFIVAVQNVPSIVKAGDILRIGVFARPEFSLKNFNRQSQFTQFLTSQYLPTSSYYAIKDNETEQILLNFDNYTKISCNENGNYFVLDTTGYPQERYFRILIRVDTTGSIFTFDKGNVFKVVR